MMPVDAASEIILRDASMLAYEVAGCSPIIWLAALWIAHERNGNWTGYKKPIMNSPNRSTCLSH